MTQESRTHEFKDISRSGSTKKQAPNNDEWPVTLGGAASSGDTLSQAVTADTLQTTTELYDQQSNQRQYKSEVNQGQMLVPMGPNPAPRSDEMFTRSQPFAQAPYHPQNQSAFHPYQPQPFPAGPFAAPPFAHRGGFYSSEYTPPTDYYAYTGGNAQMYYPSPQYHGHHVPAKRGAMYGFQGSTHDNAIYVDDSDESTWTGEPKIKKEKLEPSFVPRPEHPQGRRGNIPKDMMTQNDMHSFFGIKTPTQRNDGKVPQRHHDNTASSADQLCMKGANQHTKISFDQKTSELKEFLKIRTTVAIDTDAFQQRLAQMNRYMVNIPQRDHSAFFMGVAMHVPKYGKMTVKDGGDLLKRDLIHYISVNRYDFSEVSTCSH